MTAILMTMLSTAALAHECMVSNRSQNGEQSVGNSPMWLSENMATAESYEFVFVVVFGVEPTEEMLEQAVQTRGRPLVRQRTGTGNDCHRCVPAPLTVKEETCAGNIKH
jgi:hypothetical protein